jgi:HD-like signal output (HDOD) protein
MRNLLRELAVGEVQLPSFPDIASRVQKVLEDPRSAPGRVAIVVSSEAALAARILRLANSAFLNPSGEPVNDLRIALTRLGVQLVRCTAVSFALQQMQQNVTDSRMRERLHELWREGALVAAIAYVVARESPGANPDEALLTGLMHNIGRLYLTLHAPRGADGSSEWAVLVRENHAQIAVAILNHWKFPAAIVAAVAKQHEAAYEQSDDGLADVLIASTALVPCVFERQLLAAVIEKVPAFARMNLSIERCNHLLIASAEQIRALRAGLSGS